MNAYLVIFALAAVFSLFLTRLSRDAALRVSWVDVPDSVRKLHARPIPAVGGVALFLSATLALTLGSQLLSSIAAPLHADRVRLMSLGALCAVMMLVGLADDRWSLRPAVKIGLQTAVAVAAWLVGVRIEFLGAAYWGERLYLGALSLPVTVLWMVGITNAFNLLDGIDGLAAGAALFATMALLGVAIISHEVTTGLILASVAGATAAFLRYNFNPASIFLGDSGSLFLGFTLSVLAVQSSQKSAAAFAVAVPMVSLGLPVLDTMVVVFRRLISRKPLFTADRRHIHHLLLNRGMSVRQVAIWMYAACGALSVVSLLVASPSAQVVGPVLVILGVALGIAVQQLRIPELRALNSHFIHGLRRQRVLLTGAAVVETMRSDIAEASDADQVLRAIAGALADSGVVAATLSVPRTLAFRLLPTCPWRQREESRPDSSTDTLEWVAPSPGLPAPLVTVALPLFDNDEAGTLKISTGADDAHEAGLIKWLGQDVSRAIGTHLTRVAQASATAAGSTKVGRMQEN